MNKSITSLIKRLKLKKHPEGGYFKEVYRSNEKISKQFLPKRFTTAHAFSTAIYFLLPGTEVSLFHRIKSDETWHFYSGSPMKLATLSMNGKKNQIILGSDLSKDQRFQYTVKAGDWMGAYCTHISSYSLLGCTVAPGFDFKDFQMAERNRLLDSYPKHKEIIIRLT